MKSSCRRFIAGLLSILLFCTNIAFAHKPQTALWDERHAPSRNPDLGLQMEKFGTIRKTIPPSHNKSGAVVLHIQDVHMNAEAQTNIGAALQSLFAAGKISTVALEGAFAPIDLNAFHDFPRQDAVKKAADFLLKENKISGAIHAALSIPKDISLVGIDDRVHYDANIEAYRTSALQQSAVKEKIATLMRGVIAQKKAVFNPALLTFDEQRTAYHENKIDMGTYVDYLMTQGYDPSNAGRIYIEAVALEKSFDTARLENQRAQLLTGLLARINKKQTDELIRVSAAYHSGVMTQSDFYLYLSQVCRNNGVELSQFPVMRDYVQYVLLTERIDVESLLAEIKTAEDVIYAKLIRNAREKTLLERSHRLALAAKLVEFSLTREEWQEWARGRVGEGEINLASFENFYREADARDTAMADNFLHLVTPSPSHPLTPSVLVTGGFHSTGIDQRLADAGYTVISFTPKITRIDNANGSAYLSVFTQKKTPLDKLFEGNKLFLAAEPLPKAAEAQLAALTAAEGARLGVDENLLLAFARKCVGVSVQHIRFVAAYVCEVSGLNHTLSVKFDSDFNFKAVEVRSPIGGGDWLNTYKKFEEYLHQSAARVRHRTVSSIHNDMSGMYVSVPFVDENPDHWDTFWISIAAFHVWAVRSLTAIVMVTVFGSQMDLMRGDPVTLLFLTIVIIVFVLWGLPAWAMTVLHIYNARAPDSDLRRAGFVLQERSASFRFLQRLFFLGPIVPPAGSKIRSPQTHVIRDVSPEAAANRFKKIINQEDATGSASRMSAFRFTKNISSNIVFQPYQGRSKTQIELSVGGPDSGVVEGEFTFKKGHGWLGRLVKSRSNGEFTGRNIRITKNGDVVTAQDVSALIPEKLVEKIKNHGILNKSEADFMFTAVVNRQWVSSSLDGLANWHFAFETRSNFIFDTTRKYTGDGIHLRLGRAVPSRKAPPSRVSGTANFIRGIGWTFRIEKIEYNERHTGLFRMDAEAKLWKVSGHTGTDNASTAVFDDIHRELVDLLSANPWVSGFLNHLTAFQASKEAGLTVWPEWMTLHVANTVLWGHRVGSVLVKKGLMSQDEFFAMLVGLLFHDIGKKYTPLVILKKKVALDLFEIQTMQKHVDAGSAIVLDYLKKNPVPQELKYFVGIVSDVVAKHHERQDGTGYPRKSFGEKIPLPARIAAVVDTFDAMTGLRPYNHVMSPREAMAILNEEAAKGVFDRDATNALNDVLQKESSALTFESTYEKYENDPAIIAAADARDLFVTQYIEMYLAPKEPLEVATSLLLPVVFVMLHGNRDSETKRINWNLFLTRLEGQFIMSLPFWMATLVFGLGVVHLSPAQLSWMIPAYFAATILSIFWNIALHKWHNTNKPWATLTLGEPTLENSDQPKTPVYAKWKVGRRQFWHRFYGLGIYWGTRRDRDGDVEILIKFQEKIIGFLLEQIQELKLLKDDILDIHTTAFPLLTMAKKHVLRKYLVKKGALLPKWKNNIFAAQILWISRGKQKGISLRKRAKRFQVIFKMLDAAIAKALVNVFSNKEFNYDVYRQLLEDLSLFQSGENGHEYLVPFPLTEDVLMRHGRSLANPFNVTSYTVNVSPSGRAPTIEGIKDIRFRNYRNKPLTVKVYREKHGDMVDLIAPENGQLLDRFVKAPGSDAFVVSDWLTDLEATQSPSIPKEYIADIDFFTDMHDDRVPLEEFLEYSHFDSIPEGKEVFQRLIDRKFVTYDPESNSILRRDADLALSILSELTLEDYSVNFLAKRLLGYNRHISSELSLSQPERSILDRFVRGNPDYYQRSPKFLLPGGRLSRLDTFALLFEKNVLKGDFSDGKTYMDLLHEIQWPYQIVHVREFCETFPAALPDGKKLWVRHGKELKVSRSAMLAWKAAQDALVLEKSQEMGQVLLDVRQALERVGLSIDHRANFVLRILPARGLEHIRVTIGPADYFTDDGVNELAQKFANDKKLTQRRKWVATKKDKKDPPTGGKGNSGLGAPLLLNLNDGIERVSQMNSMGVLPATKPAVHVADKNILLPVGAFSDGQVAYIDTVRYLLPEERTLFVACASDDEQRFNEAIVRLGLRHVRVVALQAASESAINEILSDPTTPVYQSAVDKNLILLIAPHAHTPRMAADIPIWLFEEWLGVPPLPVDWENQLRAALAAWRAA